MQRTTAAGGQDFLLDSIPSVTSGSARPPPPIFASVEADETPGRATILADDLAEFFDHEERFGRLVAPIRSTEPACAVPGRHADGHAVAGP